MKSDNLPRRLADFISGEQLRDGSFESLSVAVGTAFGPAATRHVTTFVTSLIVEATSTSREAKLVKMRQRAVDFLLKQAGPQWSFNYWARQSGESASQPYPDDWDDTSLALVAVGKVQPQLLTGAVLAKLVALLTASEVSEGGPYYTWIMAGQPAEVWRDVDLAVNSNIAYFLKLQGVELPNLAKLVGQRVEAGEVSSPYYPGIVPVIYFISRWYAGVMRGPLLTQLGAARSHGQWRNPLEAALALKAGLNLSDSAAWVSQTAKWLEQRPASELTAAYPFCFDPAEAGVTYVAGSGALTAAFVLQALEGHERAKQRPVKLPAARHAGVPERIHGQVLQKVAEVYEEMPPELARAWGQMRNRVLLNDAAHQITLLPYLFRAALGEAGQRLDDPRVVDLGAASLHGWVAYTVYDDFLDNEGSPSLLPLANIAMRELVLAYSTEPVVGLARSAMDRMEQANAWEVAHTRMTMQRDILKITPPNFEDLRVLADKSMGHALGCLAVLGELGYAPHSPEMKGTMEFFRHFLIARQLSDDAHDWKADLRRGQVNSVAAIILAEVPRRGRTVKGCYDRLQRRFFEHTIVQVCDLMDRELKAARKALTSLKIVERPDVLEAVLAPIAAASHQARDEHRKTMEFLEAYGSEG